MTDGYEPDRSLDPAVDPLRWERAVHAIMSAAEPELARRSPEARGTLIVLHDWARPVFAIAASLVLLASATLLTVGRAPSSQLTAAETSGTVAEALVPSEVAAWLETGYGMTATDLMTAIEEL
jgi:hypothetical protein